MVRAVCIVWRLIAIKHNCPFVQQATDLSPTACCDCAIVSHLPTVNSTTGMSIAELIASHAFGLSYP